MPRRILAFVTPWTLILSSVPVTSAAQKLSDSCSDYNAWEWAQSIYDQQPSTQDGLDPDGNGLDSHQAGGLIKCREMLSKPR